MMMMMMIIIIIIIIIVIIIIIRLFLEKAGCRYSAMMVGGEGF
jgi:hypothetical protein